MSSRRPLRAARPVPWSGPAQRVLNARDPSAGVVFEDGAVVVEASVVWEHDGEQIVTATATRWCELAVRVVWTDARNPSGEVWLSPRDVRQT